MAQEYIVIRGARENNLKWTLSKFKRSKREFAREDGEKKVGIP
jgi:hypothetical protein